LIQKNAKIIVSYPIEINGRVSMKSIAMRWLSILLALVVLLTTFGRAQAIPIENQVYDPTVTPISGDKDFSLKVLPVADLPGVTSLEGGMLVPAGFKAGEKQFEGSAVKITGLENGIARACFPFTGAPSGWGGKVGFWDGAKWVFLPTTITSPAETTTSWACADIKLSGYYTFIKWVVDASKLPTQSVCNFDIGLSFGLSDDYSSGTGYTAEIVDVSLKATGDISGLPITITYLYSLPAFDSQANPVFSIEGPLSGIANYEGGISYSFPVDPSVSFYRSYEPHSEYYNVTVGNCYRIVIRDFNIY
jgi:hypothetical protein